MKQLTLTALILLIFTGLAEAQQTTRTVPHPPVNRYRKRDTTKPNPYRADSLLHPIPINRQMWHDKIDNEQDRADKADGHADRVIKVGRDSVATAIYTTALIRKVDSLQVMVENMPANGRDAVMDNQQRIRCLRAVWELVRLYNSDPRPVPAFYHDLVANMQGMLIASNENRMMEFAKANTNIYTLDNGVALLDNHPDVRAYIYTQVGMADPLMMVRRLGEFAKDTFAARIITAAAHLDPRLVFDYAYSTNPALKSAVSNTTDPLVQAIVKIANESKSPPKAFPFLGDIYAGNMTVAEVDSVVARPPVHFQHLVRLMLEDDSIARTAYLAELEYRALDYVRLMNKLHEEKDDVRFKCIDSLPPSALYFLLVYGQDEIYTSSFLGTFKRLVERMPPMKGNGLLDSVDHERFRTFIRMCANYNTLTDFLHTMDDTMRTGVMSNFIDSLQYGATDDLEDAVDVADAFGSIRDSALTAFLQNRVKDNYELSYKEKSRKGLIIYSLLAMLMQSNRISNNDTGAAVASARLKLPPINKVPYQSLVSDSGIVYQQVFFYGDKDGEDSYESFIETFRRDKSWKIVTRQYWTEISSVAGKRTVIYANLPLKEAEAEDAIERLTRYLADTGIKPAIMIHRGHSYHLPVTLAKLTADVKIVVLGSCGGYHNLALVLDRSPDAHIVSSKQTGVRAVNEPIIRAINSRLLEGADINWITIWRELEDYFKKRPDAQDKFSDYVPPYRNLGAIFIKAYRQMMKPQATAQQQ